MFYIVETWFISSIPIARSIQKRRWFVQNRRLSLYPDPTFGLTSDFCLPKSPCEIQKEKSRAAAFQQLPGSIFSRSQIGQKGKARFCYENRRSFYSTLII